MIDVFKTSEEYQAFMASYKAAVIAIADNGYSKEFEEGSAKGDLQTLWDEIYQLSLKIKGASMNIMYSDIKQVLADLENSLSKAITEEKQENISIVLLEYLSSEEHIKKVLTSDF